MKSTKDWPDQTQIPMGMMLFLKGLSLLFLGTIMAGLNELFYRLPARRV